MLQRFIYATKLNLCDSILTLAPFFVAARVSVVAQLAGSIVPSPGLCSVPYKSSTFNRGYSSLDSLGPRTNDSTPYTLPSCLLLKKIKIIVDS